MTRKDDSWLVLIDTSECGKLEEGVRLRPFRETGDVAHLTQEVRVANSRGRFDFPNEQLRT